MKKLLATFVISIIMFNLSMAVYASGADYYESGCTDTYTYELRDEGAVLVEYATTSNATKVIVPDEVDGHKVVGLDGTFSKNEEIKEVVIPDGVIFLGNATFSRCSELEIVKLPDTLNQIGESCFFECSNLKEITLPDSMEVIEKFAFFRCYSLTNINMPKSLKEIKDTAFMSCWELESVELPESLEKIGYGAFYGCSSIEEFTIPKNVTYIEPESKIHPLQGYTLISGVNLKKITNNSNLDLDKRIFFQEEMQIEEGFVYQYIWFTSEEMDQMAKSLPAHSTIYRKKPEYKWEMTEDDLERNCAKKVQEIMNESKRTGVNMSSINTIEQAKEYVESLLLMNKSEHLSIEVIIQSINFFEAFEGSIRYPKGQDGLFIPDVYIKNINLGENNQGIHISCLIPIKATPYDQTSSGNNSNSGNNSSNENGSGSNGGTSSGGNSSGSSGGGSSNGSSGGSSGGGSSSGGSSRGSGGGRSSSGNSGNSNQGLTITNTSIFAGTWEPIGNQWKLKVSDNIYASSQWAFLNGKWYLFGSDGYMLNSWQLVNGKWYFMDIEGAMLTGWQFINSKWYWMGESGEMATGWSWIGNKCYYMGTDGAMWAGTITPDGYAVNENGEWIVQ